LQRSRAVKLCGTEQPDVVGRVADGRTAVGRAGQRQPALHQVGGVEVLRSLAFLVRDENWGTYVPTLSTSSSSSATTAST
jgi:hypothetical protein